MDLNADPNIDGRFDTRYPADFEVWVTDMQNLGHSACGTMQDISNSGISVITPLKLNPGDIVRMDVGDSVLFGYVTNARAVLGSVNPDWRCGIEVQRVLMGESALSNLLEQALREQMPALELQH
jgi:hypothetical protein